MGTTDEESPGEKETNAASTKEACDSNGSAAATVASTILPTNTLNLALLDPPRYGWTALGGIADVLTPHERARRKSTKRSFLEERRGGGKKRDRNEAFVAMGRNENGLTKKQTPTTESPNTSATASTHETQARHDSSDRIDLFAYHRGREGHEPRNMDTGELLQDVPPTDSNHSAEPPRSLSTTIVIEFPLEDEHTGSKPRKYRELLEWDLSVPEMPTPYMYATQVAQQFGLGYAQTMDLATSIQTQLQTFVHSQCSYTPAVLLKSQQPKPVPFACHLYGEVTGMGQTGGHCFPNQQKQRPNQHQQRGSSSASLSSSQHRGPHQRSSHPHSSNTKAPPRRRSNTKSSHERSDEAFQIQVRIRLRKEAEQEAKQKCSATATLQQRIQPVHNKCCHLCQKVLTNCVLLPCQLEDHILCDNHLLLQWGITLNKNSKSKKQLSYCPICALQCSCRSCTQLLHRVAMDLRQRCKEQVAAAAPDVSVTIDTTLFPNLLLHSRQIADVERRKQETNHSKRRKSCSHTQQQDPIRSKVPKLKRFDFPREVAEGVDLDFEYASEYRTQYTAEGPTLCPEISVEIPPAPVTVIEDGSIDFCIKCQGEGSLLCCDFCPRAYHSGCIPENHLQKDSESTEKWECPACGKEKEGLPDDKIDGSMSLQEVTSMYSSGRKVLPEDTDRLRLLSILHDTVRTLMKYDFGYIFRSPVDTKVVENYSAIVKNPMDLGTISSRLVKGRYKDVAGDNTTLEDIAIAMLKDLELVWHNCLLYNFEGSAVHRMALVQQKRAHAIRAASFEEFLSDRIKKEVQDYTDVLRQQRDAVPKKPSTSTSAQSAGSRHKIANVGTGRGHRRRPIAVLDPDTGLVAKVYTSVSSASNAVATLISSKFPCEWTKEEICSLSKFRRVVLSCCSLDPESLIFGYRWVFLDELHDGKVVFDMASADSSEGAPKGHSIIQVSDGTNPRLYNSVEEAMSCPMLAPAEIPTLRSEVQDLGPTEKQASGLVWKLLENNGGDTTENTATAVKCLSDAKADIVAFVKEDLVCGGRVLAGFQSIEAAFDDWREATESSIVVKRKGSCTLELFQAEFLDKENHVDGIRWRTLVRPVKEQAEIEAKNDTDVSATVDVTANGVGAMDTDEKATLATEIDAVVPGVDIVMGDADVAETDSIVKDLPTDAESSNANVSGEAATGEGPTPMETDAIGDADTTAAMGTEAPDSSDAPKDEAKLPDNEDASIAAGNNEDVVEEQVDDNDLLHEEDQKNLKMEDLNGVNGDASAKIGLRKSQRTSNNN